MVFDSIYAILFYVFDIIFRINICIYHYFFVPLKRILKHIDYGVHI